MNHYIIEKSIWRSNGSHQNNDEKPKEHLIQLNRILDEHGTGTSIKMATDRGCQFDNIIQKPNINENPK